ncbi:uncharacterized protein LOC130052045 [Ostrea edulis]|uniref:uncharacterized protein LOC130052045 n=1 Tax=Ostrea edulis TaxID=37623 RepID=UPI0024AF0420|nr:uncharacterized protein LOC130052045 [Ostrea edulis]
MDEDKCKYQKHHMYLRQLLLKNHLPLSQLQQTKDLATVIYNVPFANGPPLVAALTYVLLLFCFLIPSILSLFFLKDYTQIHVWLIQIFNKHLSVYQSKDQ